MKKYLAGCFYDDCNIPEGHYPEKYYTDDYESFYDVVGYEGITTMIRQYGNNPEEALEKTKAFFQYLQKNYNTENASI